MSQDVEPLDTVERDDLEIATVADRSVQIALFSIDFDRYGGSGQARSDCVSDLAAGYTFLVTENCLVG